MMFSPIFFASIGIKTDLRGPTGEIILFSLVLLVVALFTKIIGCGIGARLCKMSKTDSLAIGVGMVFRGEVALMVSQKSVVLGLITEAIFPSVILVAVVTSLITPALLNLVICKSKASTQLVNS